MRWWETKRVRRVIPLLTVPNASLYVYAFVLCVYRFQNSAQHTTSSDYGCRPPFKECRKKI